MSKRRPRIYLAGPEVFRPDAVAEGDRLKAIAAAHGAEGLYPLDGPALYSAADIHRSCRAMIDRADIVVANITPFRGHHMDPGTAWEIGYAEARGKPVVLWSDEPREMIHRIPGRRAGKLTERRDEQGFLIEDFGATENLMITANSLEGVAGSPESAILAAVDIWREQQQARAARRRLWLVALAIIITLAASYAWDRARALGCPTDAIPDVSGEG